MPDISLSAGVDTSGVAAGMAAIENQVSRSARTIGQTLQGYFTAGAIIAEFQKIANAAETVQRETKRFGIENVEQFQVVTNAAKQYGLEMGTVARGMNLLEINAQKALDPTTKQALAMEHLGISAKAFAALSVDQKFFALSDAYKNSAQDGQAYADVAELIGRRNTELIPLLAEGSQAIIDRGKAMRIMSTEEIETLHNLKIEEEKYLASLDGILAQAIVGWGRLFTTIKHEFTDFQSWLTQWWNTLPDWAKTGNIFGGTTAPGRVAAPGVWTPPSTQPATTLPPSAASLIVTPPSAGAPVGLTDLAGGGPGAGGGSGSGSTAEWLQGLNTAEKINVLLKERETIQAKLNSQEEQGDEHAATRDQLEKQLENIDKTLLPLRQQLALEEQKGVDAADLQIQKSKDRVAIDELELQLQAAEVNGQTLLANSISNQIALTKIELDFNEKIQKALDDANLAREKGLKDTAAENELLAQQLQDEKQIALAQQEQTNAIATRNAQAANMQRSTDAFGVMAREGLSMGQFDWVKDPAQKMRYEARAQLEVLTGKSQFGTAERAMINVNEAAWGAQQQHGADQTATTSFQQQIDYWRAIMAGRTPANNPFEAMYGIPNFSTGQFNPLSQSQQTNLIPTLLQNSGLTQQQILAVLQQIANNTAIVHVG